MYLFKQNSEEAFCVVSLSLGHKTLITVDETNMNFYMYIILHIRAHRNSITKQR